MLTYDEADLLNAALFGCTLKQWIQATEEMEKKKHQRFRINKRTDGFIQSISILDEVDKMKAPILHRWCKKTKQKLRNLRQKYIT